MIELAEKRLGVTFPKSYKWWLKNYNGGEVCGEEIYSVYGLDFDEVVGGDIVYINELSRKNDSSFKDKLIISETDDEIFYFDLSNGLKENEYPVFELYSNTLYAHSFAELFKKKNNRVVLMIVDTLAPPLLPIKATKVNSTTIPNPNCLCAWQMMSN